LPEVIVMSRSLRLLGALSAAAGAAWFLMPAGVAQPSLRQRAVERMAQRLGRGPADLQVLNEGTATFSELRQTVHEYKILDRVAGVHRGMALDDAGNEVDSSALLKLEYQRRQAKFGKLEARLHERVSKAAAGEAVDVAIWLQDSGGAPARRPSRAEIEQAAAEGRVDSVIAAARAVADEQRSRALKQTSEPVLARLKALGVEAVADPHTPLIHARIPAGLAKEISSWPSVDRMYGQEGQSQSQMNVVSAELGTHTIHHDLGIDGTGIKLAQLEAGDLLSRGVRVSHPDIPNVVNDLTYACGQISDHSNGVAGIMIGKSSLYESIAPGAALWAGGSCAATDPEMEEEGNAALAWGVDAFNLSYGRPEVSWSHPRYWDSVVLNNWRSVVVSAGNYSTVVDPNAPPGTGAYVCDITVQGPIVHTGLAYNVITVGGYDDLNTTYMDGVIDPCESWRNPPSPHGDREKPEVVAPSVNIMAPNATGYGNHTGTSFAAPITTGVVGLLIQAAPYLRVNPEPVKAILMATAVHNIEGDSRLSSQDGAGGIVPLQAMNAAKGIQSYTGATYYACSAPYETVLQTRFLRAAQKTRAAITWDNNPGYPYYETQPSADLDLAILGANNIYLAGSSSWDNNSEIVEFQAPVDGTYTMVVHKYRCDMDPRYLGWAWWAN
jgi:hypothetical protein